jgi:hypothetical protein
MRRVSLVLSVVPAAAVLGATQRDAGAAASRVFDRTVVCSIATTGGLGETLDCSAQRRVLVRIRPVAAAPPVLYADRQFTKTRTTVSQAFIAVRTLAGKPLVFASTFGSGRARLLVAPNCRYD